MEQTQSHHARYWYIAGGIAIICLVYFLIFNSRSVSAEDLAIQLWDFIESSVLDEKKIGQKDFWVEEFRCNDNDCQAYLKAYLPPPLYLSDLGLLAGATGDDKYFKKQLAFNALLTNVCKRNISTCERFFITLFKDINLDTANTASLSKILYRDYKKKPNTLPRWFSKLHRFAVLYEKSKNLEDLEKIKKIFSDEFDGLFDKAKGAVAYSEKGQNIYAGSCYKPLGALEIYGATGDKTYLEIATQFADSANLARHAKDFDRPEAMRDRLIHSNLICADLLLSLWEEIGEEKYLEGAKNLIQYSVRNNFNSKRAFVRSYPENSARQHSLDALWAVNLLLRMPDGTDFKVPRGFSLASIVRADDDDSGGDSGGDSGSDCAGSDSAGSDTGGADTGGPDAGGPDTAGPDTAGPDTAGPNADAPDPGGVFDEDPFGFEPHDPNAPFEIDIVNSLVDIVEQFEPITHIEPVSVYDTIVMDIMQNFTNVQAAVEALGFTDPQDFIDAINNGIAAVNEHYGFNIDTTAINEALNDMLGTGRGSNSGAGATSDSGGEIDPGEPYRILQCNDGIDNDGDGRIDSADSHCYPF